VSDEHPAYTADPALACSATAWGGNHTCQCVYRKAVCDGLDHLCMCGSEWRTATGAYTRCHCNHERKTMATPVGISISAHQGEFNVSVTISADASITPSSVLAVQLQRAAKAMAVLITPAEESGHLEGYEGPDF
jgi:hypothetical protein